MPHAGSANLQLSRRPEGGVTIAFEWGDPLGGRQTESIYLGPGGDTLHVDTTIEVGGRSVTYRSVYNRKK